MIDYSVLVSSRLTEEDVSALWLARLGGLQVGILSVLPIRLSRTSYGLRAFQSCGINSIDIVVASEHHRKILLIKDCNLI